VTVSTVSTLPITLTFPVRQHRQEPRFDPTVHWRHVRDVIGPLLAERVNQVGDRRYPRNAELIPLPLPELIIGRQTHRLRLASSGLITTVDQNRQPRAAFAAGCPCTAIVQHVKTRPLVTLGC
jgi:hypothetical protein